MTAWREKRSEASNVFKPDVEIIDDPVDVVCESIKYMVCHDTGWDYRVEGVKFDGDDVLIEMENGEVWRVTLKKEN